MRTPLHGSCIYEQTPDFHFIRDNILYLYLSSRPIPLMADILKHSANSVLTRLLSQQQILDLAELSTAIAMIYEVIP